MAVSLLCTLLLLAGCQQPTRVTAVSVESRRIEVSFSERAETVLRRDYPVSLPVSGRVERIDWEPGDSVRIGEKLVSFDSVPLDLGLDAQAARLESQQIQQALASDLRLEEGEVQAARQRVEALRAEYRRSEPAISAARLVLANSQRELQRVTVLVGEGALPTRELERAESVVQESSALLEARLAEKAALEARIAEVEVMLTNARARLDQRSRDSDIARLTLSELESQRDLDRYRKAQSEILSPINGTILERHLRGPQELVAGTVLLTLGRLEDLEVVCDVLSQDALRLQRGTPVVLDPGTAFPSPLKGEVRLKEPQGFTKRSSLGVEQQRVRVWIGLLDPPPELGAGYELWARFVLAQKTALSLPTSAFIRRDADYSVWKVTSDSKLRSIQVVVGTKGDRYWEILEGELSDGDRVVDNPSPLLTEGLEVAVD